MLNNYMLFEKEEVCKQQRDLIFKTISDLTYHLLTNYYEYIRIYKQKFDEIYNSDDNISINLKRNGIIGNGKIDIDVNKFIIPFSLTLFGGTLYIDNEIDENIPENLNPSSLCARIACFENIQQFYDDGIIYRFNYSFTFDEKPYNYRQYYSDIIYNYRSIDKNYNTVITTINFEQKIDEVDIYLLSPISGRTTRGSIIIIPSILLVIVSMAISNLLSRSLAQVFLFIMQYAVVKGILDDYYTEKY